LLAIHERLLAEHGGLAGIRDAGLLASAMGRPQNILASEKPSLFDFAAAYAHGIAKNHPCNDGNKRTALMAAYIFLGKNSYQLVASEEKAVLATLALASGGMNQQIFSMWLKEESVVRSRH
jgi:death-on-curing protein